MIDGSLPLLFPSGAVAGGSTRLSEAVLAHVYPSFLPSGAADGHRTLRKHGRRMIAGQDTTWIVQAHGSYLGRKTWI